MVALAAKEEFAEVFMTRWGLWRSSPRSCPRSSRSARSGRSSQDGGGCGGGVGI